MKKEIIAVSCLAIALLICSILFLNKKCEYEVDTDYLDKLFDKTSVVDIKIDIDDENKEKLYSDVSSEEWVKVDIIINGEEYEDVGFRTKGNYIYTVAEPKNNPDYKWGYKLKFNKFNKEQTFHGLTELALNANFADPTQMKEVLNYDFFESMGIKMPYYTFGNMTINDNDFGLVTFVELYEIPYLARIYNSIDGNIYKPNNEFDESEDGNGESKYVNAELRFLGYSFKNYSAIFENITTDDTTDDEDKERLIKIIEEISTGNTAHFNINSYINYLAVANSISLLDTYSFSGKNYYLYEERNYLTFMPYDLNMSYVNFIDEPGNSITFDILMDNFNEDPKYCVRPLTCLIRNNEKYYQKYKKQIKKFLEKNISNNNIYNKIDKYEELISDYLTNDNYDFSKEEHIESIKYLKMYFEEREKYIISTLSDKEYILNENFIEDKVTKFKEDLYNERNEKIEKNN